MSYSSEKTSLDVNHVQRARDCKSICTYPPVEVEHNARSWNIDVLLDRRPEAEQLEKHPTALCPTWRISSIVTVG